VNEPAGSSRENTVPIVPQSDANDPLAEARPMGPGFNRYTTFRVPLLRLRCSIKASVTRLRERLSSFSCHPLAEHREFFGLLGQHLELFAGIRSPQF
jgi:hypothetical protein